jgi:hypothetical protein
VGPLQEVNSHSSLLFKMTCGKEKWWPFVTDSVYECLYFMQDLIVFIFNKNDVPRLRMLYVVGFLGDGLYHKKNC